MSRNIFESPSFEGGSHIKTAEQTADFIRDETERMREAGYSEEELRKFEAREQKKQERRERRLKKITDEFASMLEKKMPQETDSFEIIFQQINKRKDTMLERGKTVEIPHGLLPAYGVFVRSKSNPQLKEEIMHLFREDLDRRGVTKKNFSSEYQLPAFEENIQKSVASLKESREKPEKEEQES